MGIKTKGMTLVEVLIGMAVGSIILAGSYFVVTHFHKQYNTLSNYIKITQNARYALFLMKRDLRMAGYFANGSPFGILSEGLSIEEAGNICCDKITILYDKDINTRLKIKYEVVDRNSEKQLTKSEYYCEMGKTCTSSNSSGWLAKFEKEPISRNIENLQFTKEEKGGGAVFIWDGEGNEEADIFKLDLDTGYLEPLFQLECCKNGEGTRMSYGNGSLFLWVNSQIYEISAKSGKSFKEWQSIEEEPGVSMAYGDNNLFLWKDNSIYKYDTLTGTQAAIWPTDFNFKGTNYQPQSSRGSGNRMTHGGGEIFVWFNKTKIAVYKADNGQFDRLMDTKTNESPSYQIEESISGSGAAEQCGYSNLVYGDGHLYLHGVDINSGKNTIVKTEAKENKRISNFRTVDCGNGRCITWNEGFCGEVATYGKEYIYIWHGDEIYPYKPYPNNEGEFIDDNMTIDLIMPPCIKQHVDDNQQCDVEGSVSWKSAYPNVRGKELRPSRGTQMSFVPYISNEPFISVQIEISFEKDFNRNETKDTKTFYSSATIRNF